MQTDTNTTDTQKPKSSYCRITREDFEMVLSHTPWDFTKLTVRGANELCYIAPLPNTENRAFLVWSSIVMDSARGRGQDAIRTNGIYAENLNEILEEGVCSEHDFQVVSHTPRTNRINNWVNNFIPKLFFLEQTTRAAPVCEECGVPLVLRRRKSDNNPFWGCKNWRPRGRGCDVSQNFDSGLPMTHTDL